MNPSNFLILFLAIIITPRVFGIKCYQCNSENNSDCFHLPVYKSKNIRAIEPTECIGDFMGQEPFCKKLYLDASDNDDNWHPRIVRSCGYLKHKLDCYNYDNEDHEEEVCQCFEDGCNSGFSTVPFKAMIFVTMLILMKCIIMN